METTLPDHDPKATNPKRHRERGANTVKPIDDWVTGEETMTGALLLTDASSGSPQVLFFWPIASLRLLEIPRVFLRRRA
jgi:hypothetical protein